MNNASSSRPASGLAVTIALCAILAMGWLSWASGRSAVEESVGEEHPTDASVIPTVPVRLNDPFGQQIAESAREQDTLLLLLVDNSPEGKPQRRAFARRVGRIAEYVQAIQTGHTLSMTVVGFRGGVRFALPKPTERIADAVHAIESLPSDPVDLNNVFIATIEALERFGRAAYRQHCRTVVVIFTHARGDAPDRLEAAIATARHVGAKCFVLGPEAPFGQVQGTMRWTDRDGVTHQLTLEQGPESAALERLQLPPWGDVDAGTAKLPSGFGPYIFERLCRATGGRYFIKGSDGPSWDAGVPARLPVAARIPSRGPEPSGQVVAAESL